MALANRKIARSGRDRLADRGRATGIPPFEEAVEKVIGIDSEACAHPDRTQMQWRGWLYDHASARIGDAVSRNPSAGPTVRSATASCPDSLLSSGRQVPHGGRVLAETPEALGRIHPRRRPPARRRRQLRRPRPFRPLLPRASPRGCVSVSAAPLGPQARKRLRRSVPQGCVDSAAPLPRRRSPCRQRHRSPLHPLRGRVQLLIRGRMFAGLTRSPLHPLHRQFQKVFGRARGLRSHQA